MTKDKTQELKACPFCGEQPELIERADNHTDTKKYFAISCKCGSYSTTAHRFAETKSACIEKWNTRHNEAPTGEIEELIKRIDEYSDNYHDWTDSPVSDAYSLLTDCKAQLQQAQKMRGALEYYANKRMWLGIKGIIYSKYKNQETTHSNPHDQFWFWRGFSEDAITSHPSDIAKQALNNEGN